MSKPESHYPHPPPERSFGEHMMAIADIFIAKGLMKKHKIELSHWDFKRIASQVEVKKEDKKYLFIPYVVITKLPLDTRPRVRRMSKANSKLK